MLILGKSCIQLASGDLKGDLDEGNSSLHLWISFFKKILASNWLWSSCKRQFDIRMTDVIDRYRQEGDGEWMISQNSLDSSRGMESAPHYFVGLLQCKTVKGIDGDE